MPNYIITKNRAFFEKIGKYNYCNLEDMILPDTIAYDSETTGLLSHIDTMFCCQIGTGSNNYLIDLQENQYTFQDLIPFIQNKILVGHNITFDLKFMYREGFYPNEVRDTMIASNILYNGDGNVFRHDFGNVMERELGLVYDKSEQKNIHKIKLSTSKAIEYCFNDVDRLLDLEKDLYDKLNNYIGENPASKAYLFNCKFILAQAYLENCGLPIDVNDWKNKMDIDIKNSHNMQHIINDYIYDNLPKYRDNQIDMFSNEKKLKLLLSSPKQLIPVFNALEINTWDEKEEKDSISEAIISKTKHEFVDLWLKYKEAEHRVTTFGETVLSQVHNGFIYGNFKTIADTGRMISRKGSINLLNFPRDKETRNCFKAPIGYKSIGCDYDSQESRILAYYSQDINSKLNVLQDRDAHSLLAREAFPELKELTDDDIKKNHGDKRQIGKVINFAASFGATGFTIATQLGLDLKEGDRLYNVYKTLYADVFNWGNGILKLAIERGFIESVEGFKLKLPFFDEYKRLEILNKNIDWDLYKEGKEIYKAKKEAEKKEKEYTITNYYCYNYYLKHYKNVSKFFQIKASYTNLCLNMPIQSCASFQSKKACIDVFTKIKENGHLERVKISNFIYDELLLTVEDSLVEQYRSILEECMVNAANYYINYDKEIKMSCTANIGNSWYDTK
jgi:DNA polymerase-1